MSYIKMTKIINKLPLFEQRYSLPMRSMTIEDDEEGEYTE